MIPTLQGPVYLLNGLIKVAIPSNQVNDSYHRRLRGLYAGGRNVAIPSNQVNDSYKLAASWMK